jgi:hypothetical protein
MADKMTIVSFDVATNQYEEREMTSDELDNYQTVVSESNERDATIDKNRKSALAKFAKLGLTEEEIASL